MAAKFQEVESAELTKVLRPVVEQAVGRIKAEEAERRFFGELLQDERSYRLFGAVCICGWPGPGKVRQITCRDAAEAEARATTMHDLYWAGFAREVRCRNTRGISVLPIK